MRRKPPPQNDAAHVQYLFRIHVYAGDFDIMNSSNVRKKNHKALGQQAQKSPGKRCAEPLLCFCSLYPGSIAFSFLPLTPCPPCAGRCLLYSQCFDVVFYPTGSTPNPSIHLFVASGGAISGLIHSLRFTCCQSATRNWFFFFVC